jgi:ABC-type glycerol-3-phosphate transport system substrate-binding protein
MKRLWIIAFVVLIVPLVFFAGGKEEVYNLVLLKSPGEMPWIDEAINDFMAAHEDVFVKVQDADISTGSTITIDTMIAAGEAPDIYKDYLARTGKFITPDYAIPLSDYIDISPYNPLMVGQFIKGGKLYALMEPPGAQGMFVNLDIMDKIGYTVPDDWTLEDFHEMAEACKENGVYATALFAANQSGDYFYMNYAASFGVELYDEGYTESLFLDTGGATMLAWLKAAIDYGYAPKESAVFSDDDYLAELAYERAAVGGLFIGHLNVFRSMVEQGQIEEMPNYKFVPFPGGAAACAMPHAIVGYNSGDKKRNELVAELMGMMTSKEAEEISVPLNGTFPTRLDVDITLDDPDWIAIKAIVDNNGLYDLGLAHPSFGEIRKQMFPLLQQLYSGKISAEDAAIAYDEAVTAILQGQ